MDTSSAMGFLRPPCQQQLRKDRVETCCMNITPHFPGSLGEYGNSLRNGNRLAELETRLCQAAWHFQQGRLTPGCGLRVRAHQKGCTWMGSSLARMTVAIEHGHTRTALHKPTSTCPRCLQQGMAQQSELGAVPEWAARWPG